ncbi:anti-sigma regulatory factor (Ser/Thr protein kinase) [Pelomonas saccharophila]|uniref:Anti-sigma regulatory factor (Ser/Thr protein kinase) n=1 Tax=Roseateles saccharophilus TaxID=304 RepID=A0ABU1YTF6_ROSSA|nr:SpoIIE family protein phosphatase [Roseateles saccharophilus]MDR7271476.1 anti-sigma regulatory factor (Ser/Thr protein kinase) [Roseateles saccharophilus]
MRPFQRFAIADASQVGEARRAAQLLATELGFGESAAGRLALGVTELGTNLVRHAGGGALLLGLDGDTAIEVVSLDNGPGMDVERCLQDGFSTAGSAGTGLGAVKRIANRFSAFSQPQRGAVIAARFEAATTTAAAPATDLTVAGIGLPAPGERVSGDSWGLCLKEGRTLLLMADGLGHGPDAAEAADLALQLFRRCASAAPAAVLEDAHPSMRSTRGAAVAVVAIERSLDRLLFAGAGNVSGRLINGISDRGLMSQPGTLGLQIRSLRDVAYDWPEHAILVLFTDGIVSRWNLADAAGLMACGPMVIAGWIIRDYCRGHDDATVVVVRRH